MNSHQLLSDEHLYSKANVKYTREFSFFWDFFFSKLKKYMSFIGTKPETFNIFGLIILESGHYEDSYKSTIYDVSFYK